MSDTLRVYTLEEAAEVAKVSTRTLREYLKSGKLKGAKMGSAWRILEENLREFLAGGSEIVEGNRRASNRGKPLVERGSQLRGKGGRRKKTDDSTSDSNE